MDDLEFCVTTWGADRPALQQVRRQVFIVEQQVPEELEWDDEDLVSVHVLATQNREPVGTGRLTPAGKIGRLAVLSEFRGRGIGARLLDMLVHEARHRGMVELSLHAQTAAVSFYEKSGFAVQGPVFVEAGIPHVRMSRLLGAA
jgi:predicted GNAT family N-acyltransferase